ncbi:MAG: alpha/beta hydrolase-fold protein [Clostridia bacterium]|nr:alpha/beta hydrolase-fold protein [Clostridia bacterium]
MYMKEYVYHDVNYRGKIERVEYATKDYSDRPITKYANVYLPYGYNAEDKETKYNILYVMHGGGGNPDAWLDCCKIKNMLDWAILSKEIEPLIVVFPTFYKEIFERDGNRTPVNANFENEKINGFMPELSGDVMPAVESVYNVYAKSGADEDLKAAREHRAFTGFSMGGGTTWLTFLHKMDYFANFIPLSGDCWIIEPRGGATYPVETAEAMVKHVMDKGFTKADFKVYAATGTEDIAFAALDPMVAELKKHTELFDYSDDYSVGNLHYFAEPGQVHAYEAVCNYLYTFLPYLFR